MISLIATWDGRQIVYVVVEDDESRAFPGENSFSLAWAYFQMKSQKRRRLFNEARANARIASANLIEAQSRVIGFRLGLDLLDSREASYWLFDEDYAVVKSAISSVDDAVHYRPISPHS